MYLLTTIVWMMFLVVGSFGADPYWPMYLSYEREILSHAEMIQSNWLLDMVPENISQKVVFYLFTKGSTDRRVIKPGNVHSLRNSGYYPQLPTKIIIHGWLDSVDGPIAVALREAFLDSDEYLNIIVADWSRISIGINYPRIASMTNDVGQYISTFMDFLVSQGTKPKDFHLIGHSLGAHVAGSAGAAFKSGKVSRVTGLDAARAGYDTSMLSRPLSDSDAHFVDCVITTGGLLGIYRAEPACHMNSYPNGGRHPQPGCPIWDFGYCSHLRSAFFFAESVSKYSKFPILKCSSIEDRNRTCNPTNVKFGYFADPHSRGLYYVYTNSESPYAPSKYEY